MKAIVDLVSETLRESGVEFVIAGGYPRDLLFEIRPRDCDFWLLAADPQAVQSAAEKLAHLLDVDVNAMCADVYDGAEGVELDKRIDTVHKLGCIDLIQCDASIRTEQDVVDSFDCNINQCVLTKDGVPTYIGQGSIMQYQQIRAVSEERRDYMHFKARGLGVTLP